MHQDDYQGSYPAKLSYINNIIHDFINFLLLITLMQKRTIKISSLLITQTRLSKEADSMPEPKSSLIK